MKNFANRICGKCGELYQPTCTTQKYCGSKTKKTGCSWKMVATRDKIRGKLPHRKEMQARLSKEWKKKQRKENTDYAKRQRALKKKQRNTEHGKKIYLESRRRNIKTILACNRRRVLRKKGIIGSHTQDQWEELKRKYLYCCAICNISESSLRDKNLVFSKLTRDHIIPISRGGSDNIQNIQPLCVSCNAKKHNKLLDKVVCVSGGMDCIHDGHINLIEHASLYGKVIVILNSDEWLERKKGYVFMPWEDRARILLAIRHVTCVSRVDDSDGTVCEALKRIVPHYFANGGDRLEYNTPEVDLCNELGIQTLWGIGGGKVNSSSSLVCEAAMNHHDI